MSSAFSAKSGFRWIASDASVLAKGLRFALVGGVSGIVFAGVTALLISWLGIQETLSSIIAYVVAMPINFVGNRIFSFRSQSRLLGDVGRFCAVHSVNIALTAAAMAVSVSGFKLHYIYGAVSAILLAPVANFLLMNVWVFREQRVSDK